MSCDYFSWWVLISQDWLDLPVNTVMFSVSFGLSDESPYVGQGVPEVILDLGLHKCFTTASKPQWLRLQVFMSRWPACRLTAVWQGWVCPGLFPMSFVFVLKLKKEQQPPQVSPDIIGFCVRIRDIISGHSLGCRSDIPWQIRWGWGSTRLWAG